jgi:type IV secretion system protein VirD4
MDDAAEKPAGGLEQARQPDQEIARPVEPAPAVTDPLGGLSEDDGDPAAEQRVMDKVRALGTARAAFAIRESADGPGGHCSDELQLGL